MALPWHWNATWMRFVPTLTLAGQGGYQFTEMADLGSTDRSRWAVMLSLTVPLSYLRYSSLDAEAPWVIAIELAPFVVFAALDLSRSLAAPSSSRVLLPVTRTSRTPAKP